MNRFPMAAVAFCSLTPTPAVTKQEEVQKSPLPPVVQRAKLVCLGRGPGTKLAFDEFHLQMEHWGRFQLIDCSGEADVGLELRYLFQNKGQRSTSSYNTHTNKTSVHTHDVTGPQLVLDVVEPKTGKVLWSTTDHRAKSNQEKETINAADRLVQELKDRLSIASPETK